MTIFAIYLPFAETWAFQVSFTVMISGIFIWQVWEAWKELKR